MCVYVTMFYKRINLGFELSHLVPLVNFRKIILKTGRRRLCDRNKLTILKGCVLLEETNCCCPGKGSHQPLVFKGQRSEAAWWGGDGGVQKTTWRSWERGWEGTASPLSLGTYEEPSGAVAILGTGKRASVWVALSKSRWASLGPALLGPPGAGKD